MPDLLRDEETETRTHSLCLFNDSRATRNNRCENCPRRVGSRALYHQRRCPLDDGEQNIFGAAAGGSSESINLKWLATSSKLQHGPEAALAIISDITTGIESLGARRSRSDLRISSPSMDMTVAMAHVDVGAKRKADHEPERSLRIDKPADVYISASHDQSEAVKNATSDVGSPSDGSSDIDIEKTQQNKRPKLFHTGSDNNLAHLFSSLSIRSDSSPVHDTEDDHHHHVSTSVSRVHIDIEAEAADSLNTQLGNSLTELGDGVLTEVNQLVSKFIDGSSDVENDLRNKPLVVFQDLRNDDPLFLSVYPAAPASWSSLLNSCVNDSKALSVDIRIASIGMITERQGVPPCYDGVYDPCDPEEGSPMIADEISELSIDQIEERRSSFFIN